VYSFREGFALSDFFVWICLESDGNLSVGFMHVLDVKVHDLEVDVNKVAGAFTLDWFFIFLLKLDFYLGMPAGGLPFWYLPKRKQKRDLRGFAP